MSDLHFEFMSADSFRNFWRDLEFRIQTDGPEDLVLAGDIGVLRNRKEYEDDLKRFCSHYPRVLYTPGNHEFFRVGIRTGETWLRDMATRLPNLDVLLPGHRAWVGELVFTGGTLWYPDCEDPMLKHGWVDYDQIPDGLTEIHARHDAFRAQVPGDVVVSHHFPTPESIGQQWQGALTNVFFCADIYPDLNRWQQEGVLPRLWIHGHTHGPFDYRSQYGFRVYCNPGGYPREGENPGFWDRILLET